MALPDPAPYRRLHVLALERRRLTDDAFSELEAVRIQAGPHGSPSAAVRRLCPHPIDDVAVIGKCNAWIVVATVTVDADDDHIRRLLSTAWLELAPGLAEHLSRLEHMSGHAAVHYLGEVAIGLRSVVLGDSQVYAQVVDGLREARDATDQASPHARLVRHLRPLLQDIRRQTSLQQGNMSLERLGCEQLIARLGAEPATVAVVGLGRTGRLMASILTKESPHRLVLSNRTPQRHLPDGATWVSWEDLSFLRADAVVLCLSNNAETAAFAEKLADDIRQVGAKPKIVMDMSSPPITRDVAEKLPVPVISIDQLSTDAASNLSQRGQAVNKARQMVSEWAARVEEHLRAGLPRPRPAAADPRVTAARAAMLRALRDHLAAEDFAEIQTPVGPDPSQLDRQLALIGGLPRVYEVGPSWQTATEPDPGHLVASYTLGAEIRDPDGLPDLYRRVLRMVASVAEAVNTPLRVPEPERVPILRYEEAVSLLLEAGHHVEYGAVLGFARGHFLAELVGEDILVLRNRPVPAGEVPPATDPDTGAAQTFDVLLGGWVVAGGALRETDPAVLRRRILVAGQRPARYEVYLSRLAEAPPHGGFAIGLDRLLARVLGRHTAGEVAPASALEVPRG